MLLDGPIDYVSMPRGRFGRLDLKANFSNLCYGQLSTSTEIFAQWRSDISVSETPNLALGEFVHTKYRRLVVPSGWMERSRPYPTG
jgi:hypothetical protein